MSQQGLRFDLPEILTTNRFGLMAIAACFKSAEDLLSFSAEESVPDPNQFSKIKIKKKCEHLKPYKKHDKKNKQTFRNVVLLLPFAVKVILLLLYQPIS